MMFKKGQLIKIYCSSKFKKIVLWYKCKQNGLTVDVYDDLYVNAVYLKSWDDSRNTDSRFYEVIYNGKIYIVHEENLIKNDDLYKE